MLWWLTLDVLSKVLPSTVAQQKRAAKVFSDWLDVEGLWCDAGEQLDDLLVEWMYAVNSALLSCSRVVAAMFCFCQIVERSGLEPRGVPGPPKTARDSARIPCHMVDGTYLCNVLRGRGRGSYSSARAPARVSVWASGQRMSLCRRKAWVPVPRITMSAW